MTTAATDNISWAVVTDEGAGYDPAITGILIAPTASGPRMKQAPTADDRGP